MHKLILTVLAVSTGLLTLPAAHAETTDSAQPTAKQITSRIKENCAADIENLCKDVKPGGGRIASCLDSKEDKLSDTCRNTWTAAKTDITTRIDRAATAFNKSCSSDVQKFCSNVTSGKGRILSCLNKHESDLSQSCKNFQVELDQKLDKFVS